MLIILFTNAITNATLPTQYEWVQLSSLNLKNAQTISFKVFPFVKKSFPNHWHYFSCRLNLTIFADLRHSKQAIWWGHCYFSSVLMVIRVSVWLSVVTLRGDMGHFSGQLLDTHQVITMRQYSNSSKYLIDSSWIGFNNNIFVRENSRETKTEIFVTVSFICSRPYFKLFYWLRHSFVLINWWVGGQSSLV